MPWKFNSTEAVFIQIANRLCAKILSGEYPPGSQIPTVRQLAVEASVNPNTVQKALAHLEEQGLLCSKGTLGRFVITDERILSKEREKMRRESIRKMINDAHALGISTEELIKYIKEEDKKSE